MTFTPNTTNLLSDTAAFLAARDEWKIAGCPANHPYAIAAADVAAHADGPAIGIRSGDTYITVSL